MSVLRNLETKLADLVEGGFGRVFRSGVQPVELARRLTKEMDDHQRATMREVYVPNAYEVYLSQADHDQFADALATIEEILPRTSLTYADRIEALARIGAQASGGVTRPGFSSSSSS